MLLVCIGVGVMSAVYMLPSAHIAYRTHGLGKRWSDGWSASDEMNVGPWNRRPAYMLNAKNACTLQS